jgi:hypothetical protein
MPAAGNRTALKKYADWLPARQVVLYLIELIISGVIFSFRSDGLTPAILSVPAVVLHLKDPL